jgi:hypothetical protein
LNIAAELKHLTGNASQPILETVQETNQVNIPWGQMSVLSGRISPGANPNASQKPNHPETLLIFITPSLITPTGSLIEDAHLMPVL